MGDHLRLGCLLDDLLTGFFGGVSAAVFTGAVSLAVTFGPVGGVPVAVATLSKFAWTLGRVHVYVTAAPGAIEARAGMSRRVRLQFGDSGSSTWTFVSVDVAGVRHRDRERSPCRPSATVCDFGFFTIAIAGCGIGVTVSGSHAPGRAG